MPIALTLPTACGSGPLPSPGGRGRPPQLAANCISLIASELATQPPIRFVA